ncbi:MAG: discoidin domain-containing protein, partial [Candidatus Eremiobacteraeota bacterium]|nr:discoidin domain-containing protein [Candidatus Eremiobacteraeota bacterium]
LHRVDPSVRLGGPVFSGVNKDIPVWADANGDTSWMHRFIRYLEQRGRLRDLAFMSFEHYPFRNCDSGETLQNDLLDEAALVRNIVAVWHSDGVPANTPLYITESNFSADGTGASQRIPGALWFGDYAGASLSAGLSGVMYYQIEAEPLNRSRECGTWGAYNPYLVDDDFNVHGVGAAFYAAQLLTGDWLRAGDMPHEVYPVTTSLGPVRPTVTAYAVKRPDATWSILIDNKDPQSRDVAIQFDGKRAPRRFSGRVELARFGEAQYAWSGQGASAKPNPDFGISRTQQPAGKRFTVDPRSLTVIRGTIGADPPDPVSIEIDASKPIRALQPQFALGSTVDKEPAGTIPALYSPKNVRAMLDAGWGWLSYRLFTELSVQDWHWNPQGSFSEGHAGYWISSASLKSPYVSDSFGYRLPHRGSTTDQGNNEDYSRIDDGDGQTYWKSNPYLTSRFTGESDALHPQWVVVDLEKPRPVDAIYIHWGSPLATRYVVEYWTGSDPFGDAAHGEWRSFPGGNVRFHTRDSVQSLAQRPLNVRWVRVLMSASSNTCAPHRSPDPRNCAGYAIRELSLGLRSRNGNTTLVDYVHHAPCAGLNPGLQPCGERQTAMYVSSTDPWHTALTRVRNQEQPGLDMIVRSGLTRGLPATYPVPMIYSTPENAVAEIRYLKARK